MYVCVMFPYPSGSGLHIGHYYNYALMDSYCRWQRYNDVDVFQPFGYDAFGLPAENYARKMGRDPATVTTENINNFRVQMEHMNCEYDEKLVTSDASYIKWTQWIFTKLHAHGLAYKAYGPVNYCPSCETTLAREQVIHDKCERCHTIVEQKDMNQWYFRITEYKERLLKNLEWLDYPESTKKQQQVWIEKLHDWCVSRQRKWGCPIPIEGETDTLDTFVDSSFYYLRYLTDDTIEFLPKDKYRQVDLYVGGSEHACMHLIYARFIHMFLYDIGVVPTEEPFKRVIHQGMITYQGGKMSKSNGNAIDPIKYDSDILRMYLMFIGSYFDGGNWSDERIAGISRFVKRMIIWLNQEDGDDVVDIDKLKSDIDYYVDRFKFNKVISTLMEFYNDNKRARIDNNTKSKLIAIVKVFAPSFDITK